MLVLAPPPQFAPPQTVAHVAQDDGSPPAVAVDETGRTLVAWTDDRGRVRVRAGAAGPSQVVSTKRYASGPAVALAPDGSAAVQWTRYGEHGRRTVEVAVAKPGGRFGRPQRLVSVVANVIAETVFASGGRFAVVWWQGVPGHDHAVRYAVSTNGRFGAFQTLARVNGNWSVSAAAAPSGDVVASWADTKGQAATAVLAPGAERFGAVQVVSADTARTGSFADPRAFGGPGGVGVGYIVSGELPWQLRVATPGADGSLVPRTVTTVDQNKAGTIQVDGPLLARPASAPAVAAWSVTRLANGESEDAVAGRVDAAVEQPDGTFSAPVHLTPAGEFPTWSVVTAATRTAAVVLWPTGEYNRLRLRYAVGAPFSPARTLATGAVRGVNVASAGDHVVAGWLAHGAIRISSMTT
ncbi:hypothetical protein [Solirubrobacter soli]|uniref:hypothetical protein n=1 Tax=Solirubrobacter soli TaxID=363832 RepID=UPI0003F59305|nr:hypothetical protein [Solirubrobacter soli]